MRKIPTGVRPAVATGLVLLVPLVMTILDRHKADGEGWRWSPGDFLVMGGLLFAAGLAYEWASGRLADRTSRVVLGVAIACIVFVIWVELAVDGVSQLLARAVG